MRTPRAGLSPPSEIETFFRCKNHFKEQGNQLHSLVFGAYFAHMRIFSWMRGKNPLDGGQGAIWRKYTGKTSTSCED